MYTEDDSLGYLLNRADLKVKNHFQRLIKSCKHTKNPPYCDGTHETL